MNTPKNTLIKTPSEAQQSWNIEHLKVEKRIHVSKNPGKYLFILSMKLLPALDFFNFLAV